MGKLIPLRNQLRPTLDGVWGPNSEEPIWTHLKQIESLSWTLPWTLASILVLQIVTYPFKLFLKSEPIDFPLKMVLCRFCLNLSLFGLGLSSKGYASNLWLSSSNFALFHWTLDLGPSSKIALIIICI